MASLPFRPLGSSGIPVSVMSLGSWRTFERITREQGEAVMRAARDEGINFLDDARYNDESGTAPIPTGYSEVVFGELFRASGWVRDEVVVANKLWWEFWPEQSAADELAASLGRMGLEYVDLIYATPQPDAITVRQVVESAAGLIAAGLARQWAVAMWSAPRLSEALEIAAELGAPPPVANQLAVSLVQHESPDDPAMIDVMTNHGVGLVASYVLAGGTLTGKYLGDASGRASADDAAPYGAGKRVAVALAELARQWGVTTSQLAFCYALGHPCLTSALFGATTPEQLRENVASFAVYESLSDDQLAAVRALAV
jgi:aryl-alcohol dehydrogenase-like predicted oxidoreductase